MAISAVTGSTNVAVSGTTIDAPSGAGTVSVVAGDIVVCMAVVIPTSATITFAKQSGTAAIGSFSSTLVGTVQGNVLVQAAWAKVTGTGTLQIRMTSSGTITNGLHLIEAWRRPVGLATALAVKEANNTGTECSTTNLTTTGTGSWVIVCAAATQGATALSAGASTTQRQAVSSNISGSVNDLSGFIGDSNAPFSRLGTANLNVTKTSLANSSTVLIELLDGQDAADAPAMSESAAKTVTTMQGTADAPTTAEVSTRAISTAAVILAPSSNIASLGEAATAQLTAPGGKTFGGGRIQDDINPCNGPPVDLGTDQFREDEWCIQFTGSAVGGATYEFRVVRAGGTPLDTYTVTPELTVAGGAPLSRTASDAPSLSVDASASNAAQRAAADAPTASESLVRSLSGARTTVDSATLSESAQSIKTILRLATDSITTSEAATILQALTRTAADAPTTADAATRALALARVTTDSPTLSESAQSIKTILKLATDSITTADVATRSEALSRAAVDSVALSESPSRTSSDARTAADSVAVSLTAGRAVTEVRTAADTPQAADTSTRAVAATRAASDAPHTSESVTKSVAAQRATADSPALSESPSRLFMGSRTAGESPSISMSVDGVSGSVVRTAAEGISVILAANRVSILGRAASDAPSLSVGASASNAAVRATSDSITVSDDADPTATSIRTASDSLTAGDSASRMSVELRTAVDSITTNNAVVYAVPYRSRAADDSLIAADAATRNFQGTRAVSDSVYPTDAAIRIVILEQDSLGTSIIYLLAVVPATSVTAVIPHSMLFASYEITDQE